MSITFAESVTLVKLECANCGVPFAITARLQKMHQEKGGIFYCPSGHENVYRETEVQRLQRELAQKTAEANTQRENFFAEQRAHEATKKITTKQLKSVHRRVSNGVCPCCQRTFKQLAAHMKTKHPGYVKTGEPEQTA